VAPRTAEFSVTLEGDEPVEPFSRPFGPSPPVYISKAASGAGTGSAFSNS
jgi:hypothetical protein